MRRADREITDQDSIESVIKKAMVCRLAMCRDDQPYVVPVCFGYADGSIYIHCADEGMKIDFLRANNAVCVEFEADTELVRGDPACKWGMKFRSVIGFGRAFFVNEPGAKRRALEIMMDHYTQGPHEFAEKAVESISVIRVDIEQMTGKQSGY